MVTAERLEARRREIAASADLRALLAHLTERAAPLLARTPHVPACKALLSTDGGVCPEDGGALVFDPWSPDEHRCPRCDRRYRGDRHDRHWARFQHLWLAERAALLASLAALDGNRAAGGRAREILGTYAGSYFRYPNRDNVLGPGRLFFSTYLESVWVSNYLAAAVLLRAAGALDDATARGVSQLADEAANLIGDYDEWYSNRQTWNNAALAAIAVWFEDGELLTRAVESRTGLVSHLLDGFRPDGMWYEGENYHLFALRGVLTGMAWARTAGIDFAAEPPLAERLAAALRAPALTALPDFTFPARKDARFGVSLAQPMYLEIWEVGLASLVRRAPDAVRSTNLASWLQALYAVPPPKPELLESYVHDADVDQRTAHGSRRTLSWWALLEMLPELSGDPGAWQPESVLLEDQGLAVLRAGGRYASLECGPTGGGHGHADRLNLVLHSDGVHWLPDAGTGSYVSRDLFWYRSTLAHNAPRLDSRSQAMSAATCEAFDRQGEWAWVRARWGDVTRSVVAGPGYLLDVVELTGREDRLLEVPWHFRGAVDVVARGRWTVVDLGEEFVTAAELLVVADDTPVLLKVASPGVELRAHLALGELVRATGLGVPFFVARARGRHLRLVTVLESTRAAPKVRALRVRGELVEIDTDAGTERHRVGDDGWMIETRAGKVRLGGRRPQHAPVAPLLELEPERVEASGVALRVGAPPALDGTLEGFDTSEPLTLDLEDQYRRSEEPYPGPDELSAVAYAGWDEHALYVAVEVAKAELCFRAAQAAPLRLDNDPDDIHSDGLQVYVAGITDEEEGRTQDDVAGFLIVPDPNGRALRVRSTTDTGGDPAAVQGAWTRTERGYRVTLGLTWPRGIVPHIGGRVRFDFLVNELLPGRERRAGQLVWSGGDGWVWLRGDRQDPSRFGILELVA